MVKSNSPGSPRTSPVLAVAILAAFMAVISPAAPPELPPTLLNIPAPIEKPPSSAEVTLASYISARWDITIQAAERIVHLSQRAATTTQVDPLLVLAIVARESAFRYVGNAGDLNPRTARSQIDPGVAHGLMQVAGRYHPEKMPTDASGKMRLTTDAENLHIGAQILREYLDRERGNLTRALQRYNGNLVPGDYRFSEWVLRVRDQLADLKDQAA